MSATAPPSPSKAEPDAEFPLILEPGNDANVSDLVSWIRANRCSLDEQILTHGAVLLRGYAIENADHVEQVVTALDDHLQTRYLGTSPREAMAAHVFSASELPGHYPIPQHCEMSFLKDPPRRLYFCCLEAPALGGETPLVDFRRVYCELDPKVRERFESGGIRIIRNYSGPENPNRLDLWKLKRWDEIFGTTDRTAVENDCRAQGSEFEWQPGGRLRIFDNQPASAAHPESGIRAWFNHVQVFHMKAAPAEYRRIYQMRGGLKMWALWRMTQGVVGLRRRFSKAEALPMHCTYHDGREIPDADLEHLYDVIWRNLVIIPWQKGDLVAIDNRAVSHGRMPYSGPRTVVVSWS
jgi:alpha-ketoglutarate-dependent taurine dioxygenase